MPGKHPFHWDTYIALRDGIDQIIESDDLRIDAGVRRELRCARQSVADAWDLQGNIEAAQNFVAHAG